MECISKDKIKMEVEKILSKIESVEYLNKRAKETSDYVIARIEICSEKIALLKLLESLNIN